jgi:hypothetical protein
MEFKLFDPHHKDDTIIAGKIEVVGGSIHVSFKDYGDCCSEDGHGVPLIVEYYDKELRVITWNDINQEDPTNIISLEGARENLREM